MGALEIADWGLEKGKVGITLALSPGFSGERQQGRAAGAPNQNKIRKNNDKYLK